MYYYIYNHDCFTVGADGSDGSWNTDSNYPTRDQAAARVHYLNGGDDIYVFGNICNQVTNIATNIGRLDWTCRRIAEVLESSRE